MRCNLFYFKSILNSNNKMHCNNLYKLELLYCLLWRFISLQFYTGTRKQVVTLYRREHDVPEDSYQIDAGKGKLLGLGVHDGYVCVVRGCVGIVLRESEREWVSAREREKMHIYKREKFPSKLIIILGFSNSLLLSVQHFKFFKVWLRMQVIINLSHSVFSFHLI